MTIVVSSGVETRAGELRARAERARDWLADQLEAPFSFDLFVLDEAQWAEHAAVPVYAIPDADPDTGKIVLGSRPTTLFASVCRQFWPDFSPESRDAMHRIYGDPPSFDDLRAGCDVPPSRVVRSTILDMASSYEDGGFANYVWYQCRLILAAERLWNTRGVEALRALQAGDVDVAAAVERNWP